MGSRACSPRATCSPIAPTSSRRRSSSCTATCSTCAEARGGTGVGARARAPTGGTLAPHRVSRVAGRAILRGPPSSRRGTVREYRYPATDETIEALRRLRAPWAGFVAGDRGIVIQLADGAQIEIVSESAEVEPDFEAFRVTARVVEAEADADAPLPRPGTEPVEDFAAGGNDI